MFGQRSFSSGGGAGRADVEFRTNLGRFRADVTEARQVYQRTTGAMSDSALRMAVAQEKLDRAIHKYGAESRQAKSATLAYRQEMRSLETQTDRTGRELDQTRRRMDRTFRGALAGTGIFQGFARSIAFASSAFLGGAGLVYALRSTINAAKEAEVVEGQLTAALKAQGIELKEHRKQIDETIRAQSRLAAFDDEELTRTFITLVRRTGDVTEALRLNAIVADVARGRNISLEAAMMLVLKASLGQAGALRRVGLEAKAGADATELLALLQEKYAGSAAAYGEDAAGAQERWNVALENAQEIVGSALLPTLTKLFNRGADYLDQLSDSGELQRKVNEAVETGGQALRGIAAGLKLVRAAGEPVVDAMGGIENAAKTATILWVAWKVKALVSFTATALASAATARKMIADALAAGAAWDFATRPRALVVTPTGVPGPPGTPSTPGVPAGRPRPRTVRDRINQYGNPKTPSPRAPVAGGIGVTAIIAATLGSAFLPGGDEGSVISASDYGALTRAAADGRLGFPGVSELLRRGFITRRQAVELRALISGRAIRSGAELPGERAEGAAGLPSRTTVARGARGEKRPRKSTRTESDIQLAIARAGSTPGTGDDLTALRELRGRYQRQIDNLESRKNLSDEQKERLRQLYGAIAGTQSAIDSIIDEGERKIEDQRERAADAREKARERAAAARLKARERARQLEAAREKKEERDFLDFERRTRDRDLRRARGRDADAGFGGGLAGAMLRDAQKKATGQKARDEGKPQGDPNAVIRSFLDHFQRLERDFANNFQGGGSGAGDDPSMAMPTVSGRPAITVNQHFTTSPVDYGREMKMAKAAATAAFEGE